ncbi:PD40 domain-containing protein [Alkalitalea saponilacus]|uniref:WD40-like Beta Propeller Repeat n=1 Tax=Alkalitalea saponilacus TaxID=889453 RepID=A0A1T5G3I8_9BACT|nr:PD40 domain-containing protein [Alkalitalea saponilacus]ASB47844.1 hypothetical protein CDL62_01105 [Alkalitalea saponilacus]SKC02993.1 WD40-like Beta Propeller Repeat [Alkalitalea saponilacus]
MFKYLLIILFLGISGYATSQSRQLQRADQLYNNFDFNRALDRYLRLEERGEALFYVTRRIADCYRHLNMPVYAAEWYLKAIDFPDVEAETYYHLGQTLRILKRYEESDKYLARFHELNRTRLPMRGLHPEQYLQAIHADSGRFEIITLNGINSQYSDFGPAIWNDLLVFSSNRPGRSFIRRRDTRNNLPFFDLYAAPIKDLTSFGRSELFLPSIKSNLNDGPVSFSADGRTMYITRNSESTPEGRNELDILIARHRDDEWGKALQTLPLKMKGYSIAHPAISPDDQRLYFASDMPGGYGGMDIYYSERRGGFLSQPVNLGPHINTPGNEVFPYVDKNGRLFFSSDGLPGLGGLDIFVALPEGTGFSEPYNVGPGINSPYDDFTIVFTNEGDSGYFASNRNENNQNDNLYAFRLVKPLEFSMIKGSIINESTGSYEGGVMINITRQDGAPVASLESDDDGNFSIHLLSDQTYRFTFRKRLMEPKERRVTPSEMQGYSTINMNIRMNTR